MGLSLPCWFGQTRHLTPAEKLRVASRQLGKISFNLLWPNNLYDMHCTLKYTQLQHPTTITHNHSIMITSKLIRKRLAIFSKAPQFLYQLSSPWDIHTAMDSCVPKEVSACDDAQSWFTRTNSFMAAWWLWISLCRRFIHHAWNWCWACRSPLQNKKPLESQKRWVTVGA